MSTILERDLGGVTRHRITVEQYHRMGSLDFFAGGERIELVEGEIVDMAPIGSRHAAMVNQLVEALITTLAGQTQVSIQGPLRLDAFTEVQPDIMLLRLRADFYAEQTPGAADALLVVEVADATLRYDLGTKFDLYARHGIRHYWVVDAATGGLRRFTADGHGGYAEQTPLKIEGNEWLSAVMETLV